MSESTTISVTEAGQKLLTLVDQVNQSHQPITIKGKQTNAILISEQDWRDIQETLYLKSIPGVWKSIEKGIEESLEECSNQLPW